MRQEIFDSKYNPFKTGLRGATFGAVFGFGLGYVGAEMVDVVNKNIILYEHSMPSLLPATIGAVAVGIAYGKIGEAYSRGEIPIEKS